MTDRTKGRLFRTRFWATGDTYERITLAIILHSLVIVGLIGVIVFVVMDGMMRDSMRREIAHGEMLIVQKLRHTVNTLQEDLADLSANSLLTNALIDTEGNRAYLDPFIRSYRTRGNLRLQLTLCDFTGRAMSTNAGQPIVYADPEMLKRTLGKGAPFAAATSAGNGNSRKNLLLAYPVVWEGTGRPEGILVAEIGILDIVGGALAEFEQSKDLGMVLRSGETVLYSANNSSGGTSQGLRTNLQVKAPVEELGLEIEIADHRTIQMGGFVTIYVMSALGLLVLAVFPARTLSRSLTDRLKLEQEERKNLEVKFRQGQKLESLGVLAGGIAHDFNNLLVGIMGNTDLALSTIPAGSKVREYLERIETTATRAAELTNQMLAYSGRGTFLVEPVDLSALVKEMGQLLETVIGKQARLRYNLTGDLPLVEADVTQIRQVVMNLITNASDALGEHGGEICVATGSIRADYVILSMTYLGEVLPEGTYAFVEVSDHGAGMDRETLSRIFDPFFTTKQTGRGLGLAAVLGIVRGHMGGITVLSDPGRGATFKVFLPVKAGARTAPAGCPPLSPALVEKPESRQTILVVDDEPTVREVAQSVLEANGYDVLTAADGLEALELFRTSCHGIAGVLLDLTMPRMGGEETCREMLRIDPGARVILSTGFSESEATALFPAAGIAGFIHKPYRMQTLLAVIKKALEKE